MTSHTTMSVDQDVTKPLQPIGTVVGPVLWIFGLPDDEDDGELEMRLARFGELTKLDREDEKAIAIFKHSKAAAEAKDRLDGFAFASGRTIVVEFAPLETQKTAIGPYSAIDEVTGQVIRKNSDMHFRIGQLVRSTYSAMRATNGNYPPPKQNLVPEDFTYLDSLNAGKLEVESFWSPSMSIEEMIADYDRFTDRRPFHNRYLLIYVGLMLNDARVGIEEYVKSLVGESNLTQVTEFNSPNGTVIYHLTFKSTRDSGLVYSTLTGLIQSGALSGPVANVTSVKYGPPVNTADSGKLWLGCSAFLAVDEDKLASMISLFGPVESFRLVRTKNCLFVAFSDPDSALACRNKLFGFEIAPGHFLNIDFAPARPEYSGEKRKSYGVGDESSLRTKQRREENDNEIRVELSKMGDRMCVVVGRKVTNTGSFGLLPSKIDICNRTKIEYCKVHMDKVPGYTIWQFAAASERDCVGYDALCDYFVEKDRIGFHSDGSLVTYFIPPVEKFLAPLGFALDSRYLTALQFAQNT